MFVVLELIVAILIAVVIMAAWGAENHRPV
jgi:hypothetical protein